MPHPNGKKPPPPRPHSNSGTRGTSGRSYVWLAGLVMSIPASGIAVLVYYFAKYGIGT